MTPALITYIAIVIFATTEARRDARAIAAGKPIHHVERWWLFRAAIGAGVALLVSLWYGAFIPLCFLAAFAFSGLFRMHLNRERKRHLLYIAPWSNVYDRVMFAIAHRAWMTKLDLAVEKDMYFEMGVTKRIHRAGTVAYIIEIIIVSLCGAIV